MILRRTRGILATTAALALLLGLGACSTDDEPDDASATPTSESATDPEEDPDEAAVREVVERYWAAYWRNRTETKGEDPTVFDGIVGAGVHGEGSFVERDLLSARRHEEMGVQESGTLQRSIGSLTAQPDGSYVVITCMNWERVRAERNGERVEGMIAGWRPAWLIVEEVDGGWLVTDLPQEVDDEENPCPEE